MNPSRICVKCGGKSIVLSYTKWECKVEGCCGRD
jgi:hypothetical protein